MGHGASAVARIPPGFVVGAKAVRRAAATGQHVTRVVLAADAPPDAVAPVRALAAERGWPVVEVASSVVLGQFCGLVRPVAAAAEVVRPLSGTKVPA
jgi:ribosomal protein L7Ae-like RNA K-turn-binding protein